MNTLFPIETIFPPGFSYTEDFLSSEEEEDLVKEISKIELHNMNFQGFEAKRKVASFGYDWNFETRSLSKGKDIPVLFDGLLFKLSDHLQIPSSGFADLLVTEYPVSSVINWHRDALPFDIIAGISLHADCTFRLRPQDKAKQTRGAVISFPVQRRSLYVMKGESRTEWQHSIAPVKQVRYSVTLRTLKENVLF
jgi:alkylated DNA repair dioxygenase AlkB